MKTIKLFLATLLLIIINYNLQALQISGNEQIFLENELKFTDYLFKGYFVNEIDKTLFPCKDYALENNGSLDYNQPVLRISFAWNQGMTGMSITCDANYYYIVNGGNSASGKLDKYTKQGAFVSSMVMAIDARTVMPHPTSGYVYVKNYGIDLLQFNLNTGGFSNVLTGCFHDYQAKIAYDSYGGYMYEKSNTTVYKVNMSGVTVATLSGINNGWAYTIATDGTNLFTWDGSTIYVYNFAGTYLSSLTQPSGLGTWTLSYTNHMLWGASDAGGSGTWYGYDIGGGLGTLVDYFEAYPLNRSAILEWATNTEQNVVGFKIYRSPEENGTYNPVNKKLIKGHFGNSEGFDYHIIDSSLENGKIYFYKLVCILSNGESELTGPVSVKPGLEKIRTIGNN